VAEHVEAGKDIFLKSSVVDPDLDPKGSEPFCRIWNQIIGSDPDPEPKGSDYKFY